MKLEVYERKVYRLRMYDHDFGDFEVVGEWEGMVRLRDSLGRTLIVHYDEEWLRPFGEVFKDLFGKPGPKELTVIKADPALAAAIAALHNLHKDDPEDADPGAQSRDE